MPVQHNRQRAAARLSTTSKVRLVKITHDQAYHDQLADLMEISGKMPAVRLLRPSVHDNSPDVVGNAVLHFEDSYWPYGIQQTGPLPVVNLYGQEPFGKSVPETFTVPSIERVKSSPTWRTLLSKPGVKITLGFLLGIVLLVLISHFVDIPTTLRLIQRNLTTPKGLLCALLASIAFLLAYVVRGMRWKLFLNPVGDVSAVKAIQLFMISIFLNFLLPIRAGEVAKCLILKRTARIPVSQSLPTVAMDKALDLMPALFIMAIVPLLGMSMDIKLWLVLGLVGGLLLGLIFFVVLAAWRYTAAIGLLKRITSILPGTLGKKIDDCAIGFIDALLMGARRPGIFIPAILLTCVAVTLDGLYNMFGFWTIGYPISFGTALFGYAVFNMFYILPNPPGQVGSNEAVGLLIFAGLLHLPADKVLAMVVFYHSWSALLMCGAGMFCLSRLGLTISSAMHVQSESKG